MKVWCKNYSMIIYLKWSIKTEIGRSYCIKSQWTVKLQGPFLKVTYWATPSFSQPLNPRHSLAICAWPCVRWNSSDFKAVRKQRCTGTATRPTQHSTILMDDDFLSETLGLRCTKKNIQAHQRWDNLNIKWYGDIVNISLITLPSWKVTVWNSWTSRDLFASQDWPKETSDTEAAPQGQKISSTPRESCHTRHREGKKYFKSSRIQIQMLMLDCFPFASPRISQLITFTQAHKACPQKGSRQPLRVKKDGDRSTPGLSSLAIGSVIPCS